VPVYIVCRVPLPAYLITAELPCPPLPHWAGNVAKDRGKEFEGSYTRVLFIMGITYATLFGYLTLIGAERPALNAIVPAVGFNLSTWSLPYVKEVWIAWKVRSGTGTVTGAGTDTGTGTVKHVNRAKEELDALDADDEL
jgi:hypothetical protein